MHGFVYFITTRKFGDAGYDHLYFHQIGDDQEGFLGYWDSELRDAVNDG